LAQTLKSGGKAMSTTTTTSDRRPATEAEIEYVLGLDKMATLIESDGLQLYWSYFNDMSEWSTERPTDI
jgi:hypothetical protein